MSEDLPPELLSRIFLFKIRDEQPNFGGKMIEGSAYVEWYNMLTVCQYWYHTTIGCPQLWDYIISDLPPIHVKLFLSRSKQVPIRVELNESDRRWHAKSLRLLLGEAHHIQHLSIRMTWDHDEVLKALPLPLPLPILKSLKIAEGYRFPAYPSHFHSPTCHTYLH